VDAIACLNAVKKSKLYGPVTPTELYSPSYYNLKGSHDGAYHSESLGPCTLSIVRNSKY
jgi:hypothetical protein